MEKMEKAQLEVERANLEAQVANNNLRLLQIEQEKDAIPTSNAAAEARIEQIDQQIADAEAAAEPATKETASKAKS